MDSLSGQLQQTAPIQAERGATFDLHVNADTAFPFFSPEGERTWVPAWNPRAVYPPQETVAWEPNAVFLIDGTEHMVWTVLGINEAQHMAEYAYFVADSRIGRIRVHVEPLAAKRCRVQVRYVVTPLTSAGCAFTLENYSEQAFADKIRGWHDRIAAVLNATRD